MLTVRSPELAQAVREGAVLLDGEAEVVEHHVGARHRLAAQALRLVYLAPLQGNNSNQVSMLPVLHATAVYARSAGAGCNFVGRRLQWRGLLML